MLFNYYQTILVIKLFSFNFKFIFKMLILNLVLHFLDLFVVSHLFNCYVFHTIIISIIIFFIFTLADILIFIMYYSYKIDFNYFCSINDYIDFGVVVVNHFMFIKMITLNYIMPNYVMPLL